MSDFLLDLRDPETRRSAAAKGAALLRWGRSSQIRVIERQAFSLVLARADGFDLWGPYVHHSPDGKVIVALAGRVALSESEWDAARKSKEVGGLACKAIWESYHHGGIAALASLNGNFVVLVYDEAKHELHLVTDRCGMCLAYGWTPSHTPLVFASHPDVLASIVGESMSWDMTSLAEFLMTSRLTFPHTYYRNIQGLEPGCLHTIPLRNGLPQAKSAHKSFEFKFTFRLDPAASQDDLAEELAVALRKAVSRRSLPCFGSTGVGLSGGLDSRAVLSAVNSRSQVQAFSLFDRENEEIKTAKAIAAAAQVLFVPLRRDFDYYGNSAELGVRVSGGTGCITCNHLLGVRDQLASNGITNILTGCYADYLFKGLAANTIESRFLRLQKRTPFRFEFYDPFHHLSQPWHEQVTLRLAKRYPESTLVRLSDEDWLNVERNRTFPLAYEQDLAQRVIPQRTMPWFAVFADNDIIDLYLRIPPAFKLDASLFRKMVLRVCPEQLCRIPDNNTGAPLTASLPTRTFHDYLNRMRNQMVERLTPSMSTRGSWPNWSYYFRHSPIVQSIWTRANPVAQEVLLQILGFDPFRRPLESFQESEITLLQRLFTLKIWFDQRVNETRFPTESHRCGLADSVPASIPTVQ